MAVMARRGCAGMRRSCINKDSFGKKFGGCSLSLKDNRAGRYRESA